MPRNIRWFKLEDPDAPDDPIPGLWKSLSSDAEVERLLQAFRTGGFTVTEIDPVEARTIRRQQNAADRKATKEE